MIPERHTRTDGRTDRRSDGQHTTAIPRFALKCIARKNVWYAHGGCSISSRRRLPRLTWLCSLYNQAPRYLTDYCTPVSGAVFRQRPYVSASSHQVSVPRYRLIVYDRRAFSVAGPLVRRTHCSKTRWSILRTVTDSHWRHLYFFSTSVFSALEVCYYENALYTFTFDIDTRYTRSHGRNG